MNILRWIAVLPASIIALFLSSQLMRIIVYIGSFLSGEETNPDGLFIQCFIAVINVLAFVGVGTITAPKKQEIVAVILSLLMIIFTLGQFYIFYDVISEGWKYFEWTSFWTNISLILVLRTILSIGVSTYSAVLFWKLQE